MKRRVRGALCAGILVCADVGAGAGMVGVQPLPPPADPATLPDTPALRPGVARDLHLDGRLDEAAWQSAPVYGEFGLDTGEGPIDFPTSVRLLYADRTLWLGITCEVPPPRDEGSVASTLDGERIELFLDNSCSRRTTYHVWLTPSGTVSIAGVAMSDVPAFCRCAATRRERGFTLEVAFQLDRFDHLGPPNRERVGINLARDTSRRWASLAGIVGQGQRPEQFWTLLLGAEGEVREPRSAYPPLFRDGADVPALAAGLLADPNVTGVVSVSTRALMEVRMRQLSNAVARSRSDRWGAPVPLRAALYRAWRVRRELLPESLSREALRTVGGALRPGVADAFPAAGVAPAEGWRECAIVSGDDGTAQPYALYVPSGVSREGPLPLVVYLHGSGLGAFSDGLIFERYQPPMRFMMARVNARRCRRYHEPEKREIAEVVADIAAHWPVDTNRVSLLGFSAGAFAAAELAVEQPDRFAAIAVVAGRFESLRAGRAPALPVIAAWGLADAVVPFVPAEADALIEGVRRSGHEARVFALPATDHAVPMAGFEFWLASFSRVGILSQGQ